MHNTPRLIVYRAALVIAATTCACTHAYASNPIAAPTDEAPAQQTTAARTMHFHCMPEGTAALPVISTHLGPRIVAGAQAAADNKKSAVERAFPRSLVVRDCACQTWHGQPSIGHHTRYSYCLQAGWPVIEKDCSQIGNIVPCRYESDRP